MPRASRHRWCLLIHTLPARPLYLRAKIRRLLAESGAAPIKKAVYALPHSAAALDALRAIAVEIEAGGGSAFVCEATFPDEEVEQSVVRAYNEERTLRYREWAAEAAELRSRAGAERQRGRARTPSAVRAPSPATVERALRLRERLAELRALDRFGAKGSAETAAVLERLERLMASTPAPGGDLVGLTWVTRKGVHVDRIACTWVVRRFVDPTATLRFVVNPAAPLSPGEIGFDMQGAAITHENGGCSVETLVRRAEITDPAVRRITEIVHDIDLKDGRYGHAETPGFEQMLLGVVASHPGDDDRIARGLDLFDALYASLSHGVAMPAAARKRMIHTPPSLRRRRPR